MGTQNAMFNDVAEAMLKFSSNSDVLNQCRKIDDRNRDIQRLRNENYSLKQSNAEKDNQIMQKDNQLAELAAQLAALKDALGRS